MSKHTPGPWFIRNGSTEMKARFTVEHQSQGLRSVIAQLDENWLCAEHGGAGVEANAALLSTAPDLLEALKEAEKAIYRLNGSDDLPGWVSGVVVNIRAAIARAEHTTGTNSEGRE